MYKHISSSNCEDSQPKTILAFQDLAIEWKEADRQVNEYWLFLVMR
jgi:hypothetical protein